MAGNGFERWVADLYSPAEVRMVLKFQNIVEAIADKVEYLLFSRK
jgi:hypothetical protein